MPNSAAFVLVGVWAQFFTGVPGAGGCCATARGDGAFNASPSRPFRINSDIGVKGCPFPLCIDQMVNGVIGADGPTP